MSDVMNFMIPAIAAAAVFAVCGTAAAVPLRLNRARLWMIPAALSALFFAGSLRAIATGGVLGFWSEHIRNDWNNQIFVDLLLAAACAYLLLLARARAVSMRVVLWFVAIAATGSIGLLAMIARVLFLEQKAAGSS